MAAYRYGFNGKENDNEVKGEGNSQDYGMRIYDPRLGRFLSVDPIAIKFPELTPYQFASNRPIDGIDRDGLEYITYIPKFNNSGNRGFYDYVGAIDNGVIDVLNVIPAMYNSAVSNVESVRRGTYGDDFKRDFKQLGSSLKQTGTEIWNKPLKTLSSPEALEFVVSTYVGAKVIPTGGNKGNLLKPAVASSSVASAADESVLLKSYGGPGGGHHIPAKSAFIDAAGYDVNTALAIPNAELARLGIDHGLITGAQMQGYKAFAKTGATLTWDAMATIETQALIRGSMKPAAAKVAVTEAIDGLKKAGVPGPTRIPWGGK